MKKLKVMTILGTRPEIVRLSRIMAKIDEHCDHVIVHTGQNYDKMLHDVFFEQLELRVPDHQLNCASDTAIKTIANSLVEVDALLEKHRPEAVLVLGDTNSCLTVLAAKKRKIPIFHLEAGNRSFDFRVPEEINRRLVDQLSDVNLTYSTLSREHLIKENFRQDLVIKVGSPLFEVANYYSKKITKSEILINLNIEKNKYFIVSIHREENVDDVLNLKYIAQILNEICQKYSYPVIFSCHPRTKKRLEDNLINLDERIKLLEPFGYLDYIHLQKNSLCVISDSGSVNEEASIFGFSAINLRNSSERPEAMEEGLCIMTGLNPDNAIRSIEFSISKHAGGNVPIVEDYNVTNVSDKVVSILYSYTDYILREIWKK